jgi:hypothetical protein
VGVHLRNGTRPHINKAEITNCGEAIRSEVGPATLTDITTDGCTNDLNLSTRSHHKYIQGWFSGAIKNYGTTNTIWDMKADKYLFGGQLIGTSLNLTTRRIIGGAQPVVIQSSASVPFKITRDSGSVVKYAVNNTVWEWSFGMNTYEDFQLTDSKTGTNPLTINKTTGETRIEVISGDGTGKAVCIKANGYLGTCTTAVGAGGACTCT